MIFDSNHFLSICLFLLQQDHTCLQKTLGRIKGQRSQHPFIAICGTDIGHLQCKHVIADDIVYNFDCIVEAVDFLFKLFAVTKH